MIGRRDLSVYLCLMLLCVGGCAKRDFGPKMKVSPLKGVVHVDGEPVAMVTVECHPDPSNASIKFPVMTMTDAEGKFALGMYEAGDGLPKGDYRLAFRWESFGKLKKDKFNGAYSNPAKSTFKVTVEEDAPNDLGVIELSTKGPVK